MRKINKNLKEGKSIKNSYLLGKRMEVQLMDKMKFIEDKKKVGRIVMEGHMLMNYQIKLINKKFIVNQIKDRERMKKEEKIKE